MIEPVNYQSGGCISGNIGIELLARALWLASGKETRNLIVAVRRVTLIGVKGYIPARSMWGCVNLDLNA